MKHLLTYAFATTLVATLFTSAAIAGTTTIDKGALGKYERQGRTVRPIMTPSPRSSEGAQATPQATEGRLIVDKGALGKYERKGRFLRPIMENAQNNWPHREMKMDQGGVKHEHGLDGKEHKNVAR